MKVHIAYTTDANYLDYCLVSAASAAFGANLGLEIVFHLIETGLSDEAWQKFREKVVSVNGKATCRRHTIRLDAFSGAKGWRGNRIVYARLLLPQLIDDADWVLYVDGDTLFLGDCEGLFRLADDKALLLMSVDPPPPKDAAAGERAIMRWFKEEGLSFDATQWFCSGVILMNLKELRKFDFTQKAIRFLKEHPNPPIPDQMVICYIAQGRIRPLPTEWGVFSFYHTEIDVTRPCLIHYATDVPWKRARPRNLMSDIVYVWHDFARLVLGMDFLKGIPFAQRLLRRALFVGLRLLGLRRDNWRGLSRADKSELRRRFASRETGRAQGAGEGS